MINPNIILPEKAFRIFRRYFNGARKIEIAEDEVSIYDIRCQYMAGGIMLTVLDDGIVLHDNEVNQDSTSISIFEGPLTTRFVKQSCITMKEKYNGR